LRAGTRYAQKFCREPLRRTLKRRQPESNSATLAGPEVPGRCCRARRTAVSGRNRSKQMGARRLLQTRTGDALTAAVVGPDCATAILAAGCIAGLKPTLCACAGGGSTGAGGGSGAAGGGSIDGGDGAGDGDGGISNGGSTGASAAAGSSSGAAGGGSIDGGDGAGDGDGGISNGGSTGASAAAGSSGAVAAAGSSGVPAGSSTGAAAGRTSGAAAGSTSG
jgi:hypothetical protein